ncbi:MAG: cyclase [Anaerolineae bacterium]|nr:cyclase [Anaerolineae bacterium]
MNLYQNIYDLVDQLDSGQMSVTAYDTAWIARLIDLGEPIGVKALEWLRGHQLEDGSWGMRDPYYAHDRVISTLAAMNALSRRGQPKDRTRLKRAEEALQQALVRLNLDQSGSTVGFELIVPTLLYEAQALGVLQFQTNSILHQLTPQREAKLAFLPHKVVNRLVSTGYSAEMAGLDGKDLIDAENLQESDGSVAFSPSSTAYFALYIHRNDAKALQYLRHVASDGTAPIAFPASILERAIVFWNLALIKDFMDEDLLNLCRKKLGEVYSVWIPKRGVGFAPGHAATDCDNTSFLYDALVSFGYTPDLDAILHYELPFYFRCYDYESTPSISANLHVLGALKRAGRSRNDPLIQKILRFIRGTRSENCMWFDKWNITPYYTTAHAIIVCSGFQAFDIVENSIEWILKMQNSDGSWGYVMPTAEETAYALQALSIWNRRHGNIPPDVLKRGKNWLLRHADPPYPAFWVAKSLYCPTLIVRSIILSALTLVKDL